MTNLTLHQGNPEPRESPYTEYKPKAQMGYIIGYRDGSQVPLSSNTQRPWIVPFRHLEIFWNIGGNRISTLTPALGIGDLILKDDSVDVTGAADFDEARRRLIEAEGGQR